MRRASRRRPNDSRSPMPRGGGGHRGRPVDDSRSPVRAPARRQRRSRSRRRSSRRRAYNRSRSRSGGAGATAKPTVDTKQMPAAPAPAAAPASGAVPDWLSDLFPGGGAPGQPVAPAPPPVSTEPIEIPLQLSAVLLNNNGEALQSIMTASGANIQIRHEMQHLGYSLGIITGTPDTCKRAKEMLQQQMGLGGGSGQITQEVEVTTDYRNTNDAVEFALEELRKRKADDVPVRILLPEIPGGKIRICIGPGTVAHVGTVEQVIRKRLHSIELDLCYYQGRPVPTEKKNAIICKYFIAGSCPRGANCQYAHGDEELAVAQRGSLPSGATVANNPKEVSLPASSMQPPQGSTTTSGLI